MKKEFYITIPGKGVMNIGGREIRITYAGKPTWWKKRETAEKWLRVAREISASARIVER